ncbi:MAG: hypothetical protein LH472_10895 [Pyrinomonadaceae bacterium]|nr:hypothetical protein [Pyrinomonadaceae bacterium]
MKNYLFILTLFLLSLNSACATAESPSANANTIGANGIQNMNAADLPPGFSTNAIPMSANSTPGIPGPNDANANKVPTGNIPGIPDTNKMGKNPQPKNTPPIPGIPDQETIKKQMNTPLQDVNIVNNPPKGQSDANNQPANRPRGNSRQP